ncbi:MAG: penicillin-insensitive murein endopeptidase [Candidatus Lernaella stagnicola]|nr:penicillin-insensitive murein endopeptidase [Candidatus Lernaella stagnicola]
MTKSQKKALFIYVAVIACLMAAPAAALEPGDVDEGDLPLFTIGGIPGLPVGGEIGMAVELIPPHAGLPTDDLDAEDDEALEGVLEDGQMPERIAAPVLPETLPFADLTDKQIAAMLKTDATSLGSMSIGFTNSGALMNGIQLPAGPRWNIVNPVETWGTEETVFFIQTAIAKVHEAYPKNTASLYIGDISDRDGGRLNRHASHQAGRDVDLGFYFKGGQGTWYAVGGENNLDLARNWALVRALLVHTDAELILVDRKIQILLYNYARRIGEDKNWLDSVFQYPNGRGYTVIRHARRHHTHYHVRFYNPRAQEIGRRAYRHLLAQKKIKPPVSYTYHKVKRGQTLGHLARRYGTSVRTIMRANGLRSSMIRAGRTYRIPRKGGVQRVPGAANVPARRVPPTVPKCLAHVDWTNTGGVTPTIRRPLAFDTDSRGNKIAFLQVAAAEPAVAVPAKPKPKVKKKSSPTRLRYKVRTGDNLWTIARRYGVSVKDLKRWNGLKSNKLRPGQRLTIYRKRG